MRELACSRLREIITQTLEGFLLLAQYAVEQIIPQSKLTLAGFQA